MIDTNENTPDARYFQDNEQLGMSDVLFPNGAESLRIDSEGSWYYDGMLLERKGLIQLLYKVLTKEEDGYVLTTPVERVNITVDDAPYAVIAVDRDAAGNIHLTLNDESQIPLDAAHPLSLSGQGILYVHVRANLDARFPLRCYLQLADYMQHNDSGEFFVESFGERLRIPLEE
jgi:uncharacterized protein